MNRHYLRHAFTLLELLIVIAIIVILASLMLPNILTALTKGEMAQTLSNERQLYLATQSMALEGLTAGDPHLAWPGDLPDPSFSAWTEALTHGYLSTNDLCKLCSAPGIIVSPETLPSKASQTAFILYPIQESSESDAIFLITRNATVHEDGSITLNPSIKPYGDKGCVLMRRGGNGEILMKNQLSPSSKGSLKATSHAAPEVALE